MFARLVTGRFGQTDRIHAPAVSRPGWLARTLAALFGRKR